VLGGMLFLFLLLCFVLTEFVLHIAPVPFMYSNTTTGRQLQMVTQI
jgi:hypothetical protein